ncbi:hypothetical protein GCM10008942_19280 [Rhizomicrobium electricum]|uniref:BON domain-containing protein n=2 Tax=Rhizomicrobium electricum TaxID=480070 RepID=A0ABN1ENU7_9PROT
MISAFGASFIAAAMILSPNLRTLEIAELHAQIASVRPLVERAQAERSELSHYQLPAQAVSADRAAAFDLLLDLTKRLPDSISVSRLQVRGQDVIIEGRSTTLVDVRTLITRSPVLIDVRSTTMAPLADRFSLTAKLKPGISGDH